MPSPPAPPRLGLVIGADSLRTRRSGVGRMTLEIVGAVRHRPEIAALRLLIEDRLHDPDAVLAELAALPPDAAFEPAAEDRPRPGVLLRGKRLIADVPGVQPLRRLKRRIAAKAEVRELRAAGGGRTVYHEPNMIPQAFSGPTVVTVNDLSWHHHPEYHPQERLHWIARNLRRTLANATRFVAISHFTAGALTQELGVDPARIDVVPLAAGAQFAPMDAAPAATTLAEHGLRDRSYVLSVSTLEPRKNFDRLVTAHLALPEALRRRVPLVIVGGSGWGTTLGSPAVDRARADGSLRLLGHVDDAGLVALYARASVFAYVSLYEGFGLPVIEAMAAGCAVLASATTATGETAGDAAERVDPLDVGAIAAALRRLLEDDTRAEYLRARGVAHAAGFTWDRTATALIRSWRTALG